MTQGLWAWWLWASQTPVVSLIRKKNKTKTTHIIFFSDVLKEFSALCWLTGLKLYQKLLVPVGLIAAPVVGTRIEAFSSPHVNKQCWPDGLRYVTTAFLFLSHSKTCWICADQYGSIKIKLVVLIKCWAITIFANLFESTLTCKDI